MVANFHVGLLKVSQFDMPFAFLLPISIHCLKSHNPNLENTTANDLSHEKTRLCIWKSFL